MITKKERLRKLYKRVRCAIAQTSHRPALPIFVFGEMRSGTNMLVECLDQSPRTEIFNEHDEEAFDNFVLRDRTNTAELIRKSKATHIVFKAIADSARAAELLDSFPNAKAVWIYRGYRDVVNSALRKWSEHVEYLRYVLYDPEGARWRRTNLSEESLFLFQKHYEKGVSDATARALIWYVRNNLLFEQRLDQRKDVQLLKYEDSVRFPAEHLAQTFDFVDLPFNSRYVRRVSCSSIGKEEAPTIDAEIVKLCDLMMSRLNAVWANRTTPSISPED